MGARSQTICFCSFTVLVFYGVSVASVQKQTKGGGGGGGKAPIDPPLCAKKHSMVGQQIF